MLTRPDWQNTGSKCGEVPILLVCLPLWGLFSSERNVMAAEKAVSECVVLFHGLARGSGSFWLVEKMLSKRGYVVVNVEYPSATSTINPPRRSHGASAGPRDADFYDVHSVVVAEIVSFLETGAFNRALDMHRSIEVLAESSR